MSTQYLLPCSCGSTTPVQTAQAGEQIRCACGAELTVPTLRALRNLPVDKSDVQPPEFTWNPGYGLIFLGALGILAGVGLIVLLELTTPKIDFERLRRDHVALSPAESWQKWTVLQGGLPGPPSKDTRAILSRQTGRKRAFFLGCAVAAAGVAIAVSGYLYMQRTGPKAYP